MTFQPSDVYDGISYMGKEDSIFISKWLPYVQFLY